MIKENNSHGLEYIYHEGELYCIIVRDTYKSDSIIFFTPESFSQQLGYLPHKKGNIISAHKHSVNKREILYTQEVLFVKKGSVRIKFYDAQRLLIGSEIVDSGDVTLLCGGGHGFEILEDTIMIEVKQGPYTGLEDKERFDGLESNDSGK